MKKNAVLSLALIPLPSLGGYAEEAGVLHKRALVGGGRRSDTRFVNPDEQPVSPDSAAVELQLPGTADLLYFFKESSDMLGIAGFDGSFKELNPAWERILGHTAAELMARGCFDFIHPNDFASALAEAKRICGRGSAGQLEFRYRCKDGSYRILLWQAQPDVARQLMYVTARDVTEKRMIEAELRGSHAQFQAVLDNTPAVIFIKDLEGRYLLVNRQFEQLFHVQGAQVIGKTDMDIFPPDMAQAFRDNDAKVLVADKPLLLEEVAPHDDGPHTYVSVKFPMHDANGKPSAVCGVATDITERKRADDAIRESEQRFRAVTESAHDAIITAGANGRILGWNKGARVHFGYESEEVLGKPLTMLMPERYRAGHSSGMQRYGATGAPHVIGRTVELHGLRRDGTEFPIELSLSTWKAGGEMFFSGVIRDITERKRVQEELRRSNEELEQFAYVASHDLQEPLRMVTSYLQLIERRYKGKLDADADVFIQTAMDGASRMRTLIQDLLAYSRVGTRAKAPAPTDCERVLVAVLASLKVSIEESGAIITHDALPTVLVDEMQLGQVFQNLIANAIKFRGASPPKVHIGARRDHAMWILSVKDDGIGVDPQFFERIFIIFQRLHTREEYAGTGIGLAVCKKIVERHGGRVWVTSEPGCGTTFFFTVPAAEDSSH